MSRLVPVVIVLAAVVASPAAARAATITVAETVQTAAAVRAAKVNINTADVQELMTLAGVGRGLAEKIVQYRDANGLFKKPADLRKVEGVGGALWQKNRARIVVK
jgi:competence protein ComEA